jgi:hypothetical protein
MPPIALKTNDQSRTLISRTSLEEEITKAVKTDDTCAAVVGVIVERLRGQSEINWAVKGIKFGTADRDKAGPVVEAVVERMQGVYSLSNDRSD